MISDKHIKLMVDNTTAVRTINQMGTCHSGENNRLARQIWEWCISRNVWLTIVHIPGKENTQADKEVPACRRLLYPLLHAEKGRLRNAVANRVPASRWQGILFRINCAITSG